MNILPLSADAKSAVSSILNPFSENNIYKVDIEVYREPLSWQKQVKATITFRNGATSARHCIEGDNLNAVLIQLASEILVLKKEPTP